jgi:predicted oxidoreductase
MSNRSDAYKKVKVAEKLLEEANESIQKAQAYFDFSSNEVIGYNIKATEKAIEAFNLITKAVLALTAKE